MKKNIAIIAVAAAIGLSSLAPASAAMRLSAVEAQNTQVITVGSHSHGGHYGHKVYRKKVYKHHQATRHTHYHCHKRKIYGYWKNVCHVARHNIHGSHHSSKYH